MSKRQTPFFAADGLPARESGRWARDKLYYAGRYMEGFVTAMSGKWGGLAYVDLMAGPGRCRIKWSATEFDGSPLLAQSAGFSRNLFVERNPVLMTALQQRVRERDGADRVSFHEGDANHSDTIAHVRRFLPRGYLSLIFVDNVGLDVTFATLQALMAPPVRADLLVTLMTSDLRRNLRLAARHSRYHYPRFDSFFGTDAWRACTGGTLDAAVVGLRELYVEQMRTLGLSHVRFSPTVMRNNQGGELYRLMLASGDDAALRIFDGVCAKRPTGQGSMF